MLYVYAFTMAAGRRIDFASTVGNQKGRWNQTRVGHEHQPSKFSLQWESRREVLEQDGSSAC